MNCLERIETLATRKGVSINQLSKEVGISSGTFYAWKKNDRTPRADVLQKIAGYLGVSPEYLLLGDTPKQIITGSNIVGEISGTATVGGEGNTISTAPAQDISEDEKEILRIYRKLDRRGQNDLMHLAYQAEDAFEAKK